MIVTCWAQYVPTTAEVVNGTIVLTLSTPGIGWRNLSIALQNSTSELELPFAWTQIIWDTPLENAILAPRVSEFLTTPDAVTSKSPYSARISL